MKDLEKPTQPAFQIHLSTMILASLLAAGMIYADIHYYKVEMHLGEESTPEETHVLPCATIIRHERDIQTRIARSQLLNLFCRRMRIADPPPTDS